MNMFTKKRAYLGIMLALIPSSHCIDYEKECENFFLTNKTNHDLIVSFCNEDHNEQQQYPITAHEHRMIRVSAGVMKKLAMVKVSIGDSKSKKKKHKQKKVEEKPEHSANTTAEQSKEIDYDRDANITGLEMAIISGELDLKWRYAKEYSAVPTMPAPAA